MFSLAGLIPLLHSGGPIPGGPTYSHWVLEPKMAAYVFGVTALYLAWIGPLNRRRPGIEERPVNPIEVRWFLLGSVVALIALGPPIDDWSGYFFVSAHMFQHLLLMFVTVPCWIFGVPAWVYRPVVNSRWAGPIFRVLFKPVVCFALSSVIIFIWHVPVVYDAALNNDWIHSLQHQAFMVAGLFIWWPLMSKVPEAPRLPAPVSCLYLFLLTIPSGIVGAFITYADSGLYSGYDNIVRPWGMGEKTDQEIAGLMMWVGMNAVFLGLLTVLFLQWANRQERADRESQQAESRARRERRAAQLARTPVSGSDSAS